MPKATTDDASQHLRGIKLPRLIFILLTVTGIGLASRTFARSWSPDWVLLYGGDALWAAALYGVVLWCIHPLAWAQILLITLSIAYVIEFSQLYQAPWIQRLRSTSPFNFILGQGFLASDLVAYLAGGLGMVIIDCKWIRPRHGVSFSTK